MRKALIAFLIAGGLGLSAQPVKGQGSLNGTVRNGTTDTPAAGITVLLIQLQGGMETVANTKTDAQGRFHFDNPSIGRQPMLVRAIYRGVNFHQPVPPGRDTADVQVFEPTTDEKSVTIASRLIVFEPKGDKLLAGEEFFIENNSKPAATYFKSDGNFEFQIPEHATLQQVAAWGPSGMPVVQGTMDRGSNRYAIAYPFHPGKSGVRFSYVMPYPSNEAVVRIFSPYAARQVAVGVPPPMKVDSPGMRAAGTDQGLNMFTRDAVPAGGVFDVTVSGTATPPAEADQQQGGEDSRPIQQVPSRIDSLKWPLVGGFLALFAIGAFFLWRQPAVATAQTGNGSVQGAATKQRPSAKKRESAGATEVVAQIDQQVGNSLDALKDTLFRLELRHQAGTIGEEEYARERARVENILRDLVKG